MTFVLCNLGLKSDERLAHRHSMLGVRAYLPGRCCANLGLHHWMAWLHYVFFPASEAAMSLLLETGFLADFVEFEANTAGLNVIWWRHGMMPRGICSLTICSQPPLTSNARGRCLEREASLTSVRSSCSTTFSCTASLAGWKAEAARTPAAACCR